MIRGNSRAYRRKTKIVATIGPASNTPEIIRDLITSGMNLARLNFSHGSHQEHSETIKILRTEAENLGSHLAVLQDLCGPKVRLLDIENGELVLNEKDKIQIQYSDSKLGNSNTLFVSAFNPVDILKPGEKVLLSDGRVELVVEEVSKEGATCRTVYGGVVRSRSGIVLPNSRFNLPALTEKDLSDLNWAVENKVDYIALSFVTSAKDIFEIRQRLRDIDESVDIPIVAKFERAMSIDHITEIVEAADAVMIARGDLGLELPLEKVPSTQRMIIQIANHRGTPVITATQMLQSMVESARPTRAEVSDVSTAVRDGTDAVMLSEETAVGSHPKQTIEVLDRILQEAEKRI